MAENFAVGDIVQLKSGGPKMTLESISGSTASCVWFEGSKQTRNRFILQTLTKSNGGDGYVVA